MRLRARALCASAGITRYIHLLAVGSMALSCGAASWGTPVDAPRPEGLGRWNHDFQARFAVQQGPAHHSLQDPIVAPREGAVIDGKFAYGPLSKDLEDEDVLAYVKHRGHWFQFAAARTDGDGRVSIRVLGDKLTSPGEYPIRLVVRGDGSYAAGAIWVLARGSNVAVFDIDGTLTEDNGELAEAILLGREPEVRPNAKELVQRWTDADSVPLYLTGRPYMLAGSTRQWLERHGFMRGPVRTASSLAESVGDGVVELKSGVLRDLSARIGVRYTAAYGDASTDVCAYASGGVLPDVTYIFGEHGGETCPGFPASHAVTDVDAHLRELNH